MSGTSSEPRHRVAPLWWRFGCMLLRPRMARAIARVALDGYLTETGWLRSAETRQVVNAQGEPMPWATLPFIAFIRTRLRSDMQVFEYGSGASTLFYATRVAKVVAVEDDPDFADALQRTLPKNARVLVRQTRSEEYRNAVKEMVSPDLVSIDGRDRVRCALVAISHLSEAGVIAFDDTDRTEYSDAWSAIASAGFRRLDFWGLAPLSDVLRCTSVFYRPGNILGI